MGENKKLFNNISFFDEKYNLILQESQIRFAGIIDCMGNLVAGGFKDGISPLKDESARKRMFMEATLRVRTRQDFDKDLGPVKYAASRRDKVVMMTFPVQDNHILFLSVNPGIDIETFAQKIVKMMNRYNFSSCSLCKTVYTQSLYQIMSNPTYANITTTNLQN